MGALTAPSKSLHLDRFSVKRKNMMKNLCEEKSDPPNPLRARNLKALRKRLRQTQTEFWYRFGVTQSRGSRFEKGYCIPPSVAILIELYVEKKVNDADLQAALQNSGGIGSA
jgi:DNA-binding transcriptional regulator YiaG